MKNLVLINNKNAFSLLMEGKGKIVKSLLKLVVLQRIVVKLLSVFAFNIQVKEGNINQIIWDDNTREVSCVHDEGFLKWKFSYKNLHVAIAYEKDREMASCLYEISEFDSSEIIKIHVFSSNVAEKKSEAKFLAKVLDYLSKKHPNAAFVRVWIPQDSYNKEWERLFFIKSEHKNPFIVSRFDHELTSRKWNLSFYDLD